MCFDEGCMYQFIVANNFCLLELILVAHDHLDELQKAVKYPIRCRYRQVSLYFVYGCRVGEIACIAKSVHLDP